MVKLTPIAARQEFKDYLGLTFFMASPLSIVCGECSQWIPSDTPWCCGACNFLNMRARYFSLLNKCRNCKCSPGSFICPHCNALNFLDSTYTTLHPARLRGGESPAAAPSSSELRNERVLMRQFEKEEMEHQILLTQLAARLQKEKSEASSRELTDESLKQSLIHHETALFSIQRIAKARKEALSEELSDDEDLLKRAHEAIDDWVDLEMAKHGL